MQTQINDGMELEGSVAGRGPFPAIVFRFRPAMPDAVYEYQDAGPGKKRLAATIKVLVGCLKSWDVKDDKGEPTPVTEAALKRIPAPQLDRMLNYVTCYAMEELVEAEKN